MMPSAGRSRLELQEQEQVHRVIPFLLLPLSDCFLFVVVVYQVEPFVPPGAQKTHDASAEICTVL